MTAPAGLAAPATHTRRPGKAGYSRRRNAGPPDPKLVLLLASGSIFIAALDLTIVNVAFPDIRADFATASLPTLSWVVTGYGVLFAALLAPAGRLADVISRQRLFGWSVAAFTVTSALCTAAPDEGLLIFFRVLQGAAAAGMYPAGLGLLLTWTPRERLMAAIGVWGASGAVATAAGPALGGVLVEAWGWRAIFLVNVPFGLAILHAAMTKVSRDTPGGGRLPDPVGTVLLTAGTGAVVVALSQGSEWGWASGSVLLPLVGGVLGVGLSLVRSARHPAPVLELDLWRDRVFTVANATSLLFSVSLYAFLLNGPLFLTETWGYSVLEAGLALTPAALASVVGALVIGKRATTPARRRAAAVGGSLLAAGASFLLWARLGTEPRFAEVYLPAGLLNGVGIGVAFTALVGAGATSLPSARFASGSGVLAMTRQLGGALGVAAMAAILAASGYADAVDPFLAVYLFSGVVALAAAAVGVGLVRPSPATGAAAEGGAAGSRRRGRLVAAVTGVAVLAGVGVFAVVSAEPDTRSGGEAVAAEPDARSGNGAVAAGRSLVLIDVSASTGGQAGAGMTRLQAATGAVTAGVGPAPESNEVGIWLVGSRFQDERDWAQLLPVGALSERFGTATRRQLIQSNLGGVGAVPGDRLGLYDAVLAAFHTMNSTYQPGMSNAVVVFTDGRDDDPAGTTLENLLATLEYDYDPSRPVHVYIIGYGEGVDRDSLTRIAQATGGGVYAAGTPQQAREFFRAVMSSHA